jgi:methyltransferase (TIGR00027 family)
MEWENRATRSRRMQEGRSSQTAAYVALLRALGDRGATSARGFRDEVVQALLPPLWSHALALFGRAIPRLPARARERLTAHVDLLVLRSLAIDSELTHALATGCHQVVILGAGLDSRAYRMKELATAHVFEVDHRATQSEKQRRATGLLRTCRELTYVACDFESEPLAERLQLAGHRDAEPTVWIWEGVTLYLDDRALRSTLAAVAARSTAKSALIVEYHDADVWKTGTAYSVARRILLALWSEPQIGSRTQRAMHADIESAGLHVERDFGSCEWGAAFAGAAPPQRTSSARLAIATA